MLNHLRPITDPPKEQPTFAVCDIEVRSWIHFLVIGYYDGENEPEYFYSLTDFVAFIMAHEVPTTIYAHFGSIFDFMFILGEVLSIPGLKVENMIPRGSGLLCFDISDGTKTITFSDSSAFLPFGLRALCESFKVKHPKLDVDYSRITKVTRKLIKYLEHDLKGLYECIYKFRQWPLVKQSGPKMTMASQAMQVLRLFLEKKIHSLETGPDSPDEFVRRSYFGGRTEIFKPLFINDLAVLDADSEKLFEHVQRQVGKKLYLYDVNSLYPTVMRDNEMPNKFIGMRDTYNGNLMGFYHVKVNVPKKLKIPPLGTVLKVKSSTGEMSEKFVFVTGVITGYWSTIELEYAKSLGCEILECYKGYIFESGGYIFRDYINDLYAIRLKAKDEKDSVSDLIAKLLMNSCYGRMGLNKLREQLEFDDGQGIVDAFKEIETRQGTVRLVMTEKELENSFSNVSIAAWVTSHARIYMHKIYMECADELYYTDTDSIFTTKLFAEGAELGALKLEYKSNLGCFLLPKTYLIDDMINYTVWKAVYHERSKPQSTVKRGAPFTLWHPPTLVSDKFRVLVNTDASCILEALGATLFEEKTGIKMPGLEDIVVKREPSWIDVHIRGRGWLRLDLLHKKVVMKGFDKKKIHHFGFEDFACHLEGDMRAHASGMGPKPLFVDIAPKFATFKTAINKGKMVSMTEMTHREIKARYDKRKIIKRKVGDKYEYDTRPLHIRE